MGQKNQLWWDLPSRETFLLNKAIYDIPDDIYRKNVGELVELMEVEKLLGTPVRKLSLGERMKMELIAALLHSPQVLFLDEPTIGLDVVMQKKMQDYIRMYSQRTSATILLTSHYMEDVRQLAKRIIVINQGAILYDGSLINLVKKFATYKLLSLVVDEYVNPQALSQIGELVSYDYPQAVIKVGRERVKTAASRLLSTFPVDDLNIEEPDIETVIRELFAPTA
jgi:ABC-2 type transport system ATP-binding protein